MQKVIIATIQFLVCLSAYGQNDIIKEVLEKNLAGKEFYFDSSTTKDGLDKIYIKFLGEIKTFAGRKYKILTWKRVWGSNKHTTGVVFVFSSKNEFVGKYYLGSSFELPDKIEDSNLIFTNKGKPDCETNLITKVSFCKGLPKEFFLKCKGEYGDVYTLSQGK